jgi:hypothetical protein
LKSTSQKCCAEWTQYLSIYKILFVTPNYNIKKITRLQFLKIAVSTKPRIFSIAIEANLPLDTHLLNNSMVNPMTQQRTVTSTGTH